MKLNNKFTLISVALMTGAACLTACSSDEVAENPGLSADGESVKTQFALNIPVAGRNARMNAEEAQANKNFRGMEDIYLITRKNNNEVGEAETRETLIKLANIKGDNPGFLEDQSATEGTKNVKVYKNVNVPIGTQGFLFYSHAQQGSGNKDTQSSADNFKYGVLHNDPTLTDNPKIKDIKYNLVKAAGTDQVQKETILNTLNAVVNAFGNQQDETQGYGKLLKNFKTLTAGSAESVRLTLQALYNKVADLQNDNTATAIKEAIVGKNGQNGPLTATGSTGAYTLKWAKDNTFPRNINLPDGAAIVTCEKNAFDWVKNPSIGATDNNVNVENITFPASLYYYTQTDVKVANTDQNWPTNTGAWTAENAFQGWGNEVKADTRKIALAQTINYAVAQLALSVKCATPVLEANVVEGADQVGQNVTVPSQGFNVTGVLVGGQPDEVGYNFQPIGTKLDQTVYDSVIANPKDMAKNEKAAGIAAKYSNNGEYSDFTYTLLLPNKTQSKEQNVVHFAIEFENTSGVDFRGVNGIIPAGGKFYLIGKLNPAKATQNNTKAQAVFESDFQTKAKINIKSLKNAYNTIPDLRSTNLELGLAVDLEWQQGLEFSVDIE